MTEAYAADFVSPEFVALTYGIHEGPNSYGVAAEDVSGSTAKVLVLGYWGADLGRQWRFGLQWEKGLWRTDAIDVVDTDQPAAWDEAPSPLWRLYPVVEEFIVYPDGGWMLAVTFDEPTEDTLVEFRMVYVREDDWTIAYTQEDAGVIGAGWDHLTLDSDWSSHDLAQLGFRPGNHWMVAHIDDVDVAAGELVID